VRKAEKIIIRLPCRIEHVFELLTGLYIALQESALAKRRKAMCINALGWSGDDDREEIYYLGFSLSDHFSA